MAGQYERFDDDAVTAPDDENASTSGSEGSATDHAVTVGVSGAQAAEQTGSCQTSYRMRLMEGQWPTQVGVVHLTFGMLLTLLGEHLTCALMSTPVYPLH